MRANPHPAAKYQICTLKFRLSRAI